MTRFLRDSRISHKLFAGFSIILFFLLALSGYTVFSTWQVQKKAREVESQDFYSVKLATELKDTLLKISGFVGDVIVTGKKGAYENIDIQSEKFHILAKELKEIIGEDQEQVVLLERVEKDFDGYSALSRKIASSYIEGRFDIDKGSINEFYRAGEEIRSEIEDFHNEYVARFSQTLGTIYDFSNNVKAMNVILAGLMVFLGILLAWQLTKHINSSVIQLVRATKRFAAGDLAYRLKPASKDELGQLMDSFNWMAESLQDSVDEIKTAADSWETFFINSFREWILINDKDSRIVKVNNAFANRFDKRPQDLIGKTYCEVVREASDKGCIPPDEEAKRLKKEVVFELFESHRGIFVEISALPILDKTDEVARTVLIVKDITSRKELERSQRLTQLGRLVSNIAHEVNNPLMIILGRAQLSMMEDIHNDAVSNSLGVIAKECLRAKEYIANLLSFARPSKNEAEKADINKVMADVLALVEHSFSLRGIVMKKSYAEGLPQVSIDTKQIQEVFLNLINNAREAIVDKGSIEVATSREGKFVKIDITDSGPGMTQEAMGKMFEPFYTTKKDGTGLGLSICYSIISAHNGELKADSIYGKGTTISVLLPATEEGAKNG